MNDIAEQKSFEQRMISRIREDIGKLMTDDELSKIVERATEEIFFKETIIEDGSWHKKNITSFYPSINKGSIGT